jgi:hypothetical protein
VRTLWRLRGRVLEDSSRAVQHIQYENKRRDRELVGLHRKAAAAGMKLVPIT